MCDMTHTCVWHDSFILPMLTTEYCPVVSDAKPVTPVRAAACDSNETWQTGEWVMRLSSKSHVTYLNGSWPTYQHVDGSFSVLRPVTWMRHVTRVNELCDTYVQVMSHTWMSHATHIYICGCEEKEQERERKKTTERKREKEREREREKMDMCDMTHSSLHICGLLLVTWMRHVARMHEWSEFKKESGHTSKERWRAYEWVESHVWMSHVTCMNHSYHAYECVIWIHACVVWIHEEVIWIHEGIVLHLSTSNSTHIECVTLVYSAACDMNETCHTHGWVMDFYEGVMSHL